LKKILVVINPKAGVRSKLNLKSKIVHWFGEHFEISFLIWESAEFDISSVLIQRLSKEKFDVVIAAGGDGTVNRTAKALVNTGIPFAILPLGSGNGLAHHFKIPMNIEKAVRVITNGKVIDMDTCTINDESFFCTAGTGFDAHIGHLFAKAGKRGFATYSKIVFQEFNNYHSDEYRIVTDGREIVRKAFLVTVANANQYGNNTFIAPQADVTDGLMDVIILKPFRLVHAPSLVGRLFLKNIHKSAKIETIKAKEVIIYRKNADPVHFDGEPAQMQNVLHFKIVPRSLSIYVPK